MALTREQFNEAIWNMIGPDQLKTIVDGVKQDVGEAYNLGSQRRTSMAGEENDVPAFLGYQPGGEADWEQGEGPGNEPPHGVTDWGDAEYGEAGGAPKLSLRGRAASQNPDYDPEEARRRREAEWGAWLGEQGSSLSQWARENCNYLSTMSSPSIGAAEALIWLAKLRYQPKAEVVDWGGADYGEGGRWVGDPDNSTPNPAPEAMPAEAPTSPNAPEWAAVAGRGQPVASERPAPTPESEAEAVTSIAAPPTQTLPTQTPLSAWEQEFQKVHGRAPTSYDAMVKGEMERRMQPGQTPTRADWVNLTNDLNRRGVYGPRDVPEFAPGFGPNAQPQPFTTDKRYTGPIPGQPAAPTPAQRAQTAQNQPATPATTVTDVRYKPLAPPSVAAVTGMSPGYATYAPIVDEHAQKYGVDPNLVASLIQYESGFNPEATSQVGAQGLMQIMPATGKGLGLTPGRDAYYPRSNIDAGTKFLKSQLDYYADRGTMQVPLALAAYNWGGANVNAMLRGEKTLPTETENYVKAVIRQWQALARR